MAEVCSVSAPAPAPGGEVRAFNGLGAFAVGVDLEPVDTAFVVNGNAMKLQWPDGCVDAIYTNVFDHLPSLDAIAKEVARLLKPGGIFFGDVEAQFRKMDSWAVRDTGTGAFYAELATAMAATNVMRHCYTHELYANRSGGSRCTPPAQRCHAPRARALRVMVYGRRLPHAAHRCRRVMPHRRGLLRLSPLPAWPRAGRGT